MKKKVKISVRLLTCVMAAIMLLACLTSCNYAKQPEGQASPSSDDVAVNAEPKKRVALTFDDGPHNVRTALIVDELAKYGYHATFFVVGNRVDGTEYNGRSGLEYAASKGNEIGIHGYTHSYYYDTCDDESYRSELSKTEAVIKDVVKGEPVRLMRPVGGRITQERLSTCKYSVIMWSVDSEDWKYKYKADDNEEQMAEKVDIIVNNVMSSVEDGSIILMHDIYLSTYDAVVVILERLHAEGYEVVTVSQLLGSDLAAGKSYSQGDKIIP